MWKARSCATSWRDWLRPRSSRRSVPLVVVLRDDLLGGDLSPGLESRARSAGGSKTIGDGALEYLQLGEGQEEASDIGQVRGPFRRLWNDGPCFAPSDRSIPLAEPPGPPRPPGEGGGFRLPEYPRGDGSEACEPGTSDDRDHSPRSESGQRSESVCERYARNSSASSAALGERMSTSWVIRGSSTYAFTACAPKSTASVRPRRNSSTASWIVASGRGSRMMNSRNVSEPSPNMNHLPRS